MLKKLDQVQKSNDISNIVERTRKRRKGRMFSHLSRTKRRAAVVRGAFSSDTFPRTWNTNRSRSKWHSSHSLASSASSFARHLRNVSPAQTDRPPWKSLTLRVICTLATVNPKNWGDTWIASIENVSLTQLGEFPPWQITIRSFYFPAYWFSWLEKYERILSSTNSSVQLKTYDGRGPPRSFGSR